MKLEKLRERKKHSRWLEGIFSKNPVFVKGLALPFAIMITTNLKNAVALSIIFACVLIPTVLLASLTGKYLPRWLSMMVYSLFAMALVIASIPLIQPISPEIGDSLGIYIPIVAVNAVLQMLCLRYSEKNSSPTIMALTDAVTYSIGFCLALCLIAALREYFGSGTLWGISVQLPVRLSGLQVAFSGFILTAFFSAFFRFVKRFLLCLTYRRLSRHAEGTASL